MTQAANLIRQNSALLNTDMAAYKAAKARKQKDAEFTQLMQKVERLESIVDDLTQRIKEMESNVCS